MRAHRSGPAAPIGPQPEIVAGACRPQIVREVHPDAKVALLEFHYAARHHIAAGSAPTVEGKIGRVSRAHPIFDILIRRVA